MRALSIIGIILFTWLIFNRYTQYEAIDSYVGKSVIYTSDVVTRFKHSAITQILVGVFGLLYAIMGTVYFFKRKEEIKEDKKSN